MSPDMLISSLGLGVLVTFYLFTHLHSPVLVLLSLEHLALAAGRIIGEENNVNALTFSTRRSLSGKNIWPI